MKTLFEVLRNIISSSAGAISWSTCASYDPHCTSMLEILESRLRSRPSRVMFSITEYMTPMPPLRHAVCKRRILGSTAVTQTLMEIFGFPDFCPDAVILHIDDQQGRVRRVDRRLAARCAHPRRISA
jgi:hypothetical protein